MQQLLKRELSGQRVEAKGMVLSLELFGDDIFICCFLTSMTNAGKTGPVRIMVWRKPRPQPWVHRFPYWGHLLCICGGKSWKDDWVWELNSSASKRQGGWRRAGDFMLPVWVSDHCSRRGLLPSPLLLVFSTFSSSLWGNASWVGIFYYGAAYLQPALISRDPCEPIMIFL